MPWVLGDSAGRAAFGCRFPEPDLGPATGQDSGCSVRFRRFAGGCSAHSRHGIHYPRISVCLPTPGCRKPSAVAPRKLEACWSSAKSVEMEEYQYQRFCPRRSRSVIMNEWRSIPARSLIRRGFEPLSKMRKKPSRPTSSASCTASPRTCRRTSPSSFASSSPIRPLHRRDYGTRLGALSPPFWTR